MLVLLYICTAWLLTKRTEKKLVGNYTRINKSKKQHPQETEALWQFNWAIGLMSRVFANGLGDWGSIPGRVITKTQKMLLDAILLNTQHYKVWIKGKVEQSRERGNALPYTSVL